MEVVRSSLGHPAKQIVHSSTWRLFIRHWDTLLNKLYTAPHGGCSFVTGHPAKHTNCTQLHMEVVHSSLGHPAKHTNCTQLHMEVVHSSLGHPAKHTNCTQLHMEVVHSSLGHPAKHTNCTQLHMEVVHSSLGHPAKQIVHSSTWRLFIRHWDTLLNKLYTAPHGGCSFVTGTPC